MLAALKHPQGAKKSDRQIAEHVGVGHVVVSRYRQQLESSVSLEQIPVREVTRGGTTYQQNTANIGKVKFSTVRPSIASQSLSRILIREPVNRHGLRSRINSRTTLLLSRGPTRLNLFADSPNLCRGWIGLFHPIALE